MKLRTCINSVRSVHRHVSTVENVRSFDAIPGPLAMPIFGNQLSVRFGKHGLSNYMNQLADWHKEYGNIVKEERGWSRETVIHLFHPDDVRSVLAIDGKQPLIVPLQETTQMYRQMRSLSLGLGNMNGPEWYRLRSAVQQAMMQPRAVHQYIPLVENVAKDFIEFIAKKKNGDGILDNFRQVAARWSLESSGNLVFEKRLGCTDAGGENETWACQMVDRNIRIFVLSGLLKFKLPLYRYIATPKWKELVEIEDAFYSEVKSLIDETISRLSHNEKAESDLMFVSYLLTRKELSKQDVAIIMFSLFSDGLSTTAPTLIYILYCLAKYPQAQQKLYEEIRTHVHGHQQITPQTLNKLTYLKACMKEAMRLYPIGTEVSRVIQQDLVLSGYHVPAGTAVDINMTVCLHSDQYFENATTFNPNRWIRDSEEYIGGQVHPFVLLPFGHGPRMCAGRRFAEQDLQILICRLLQKFDVQCIGNMKQELVTLLFPKGDYQFKFIERKM